MAVDVGTLIATLKADTSQFVTSLSNANLLVVGLGATFAASAYAAVSWAASVTESASRVVESMDFMAQRTGVSLQAFQELQPVFNRNGVSAEQLGGIFRILSVKMEEAQDSSSKAAQAFDKLGLSFKGNESSIEVLTLIAERIKLLPAGFEKSRIETELLGRSGGALNAVLNEGAEGFRKSADEAHNMANVLNTEANAALLAVNDSFDNLNTKSDNLSKHLAVMFAPFIQALNEAKSAFYDWSVSIVDQATVASRTIGERLRGLWGYLKETTGLIELAPGQAAASWDKWNTEITESIAKIRELGVTAKKTESSVGAIDTKAQAITRSAAKAMEAFFVGLTQVDMGWKIVQESITAYGRSQEALGQYITTTLIQGYKDLQTTLTLYAKSDFENTNRAIDQYKAMEDQAIATAHAKNQAALGAGTLSGTQFATAESALAIQGIDAEIAAQQKKLEAISANYATQLALAQGNDEKTRGLVQQNLADAQTVNNDILKLQEKRVTASTAGEESIANATRQANKVSLQAAASMASSELSIAQSNYADTSELRALRMAEIEANQARELAAVNLTSEQIIAIHKHTEAERMAAAKQFPTFFDEQMQSIVSSSSFSMGQLVNQFSGAMADWMLGMNTFQNFFKSAMRTLVQSFVNIAIRGMAEAALASGTGKMFGTFALAAIGGMNLEGASGAATAAGRGAQNPALFGPGFAHGGDFIVGGSGGTDTTPINFMATPGEMVSIRTPGQMSGGNNVNIAITVNAGEGTKSSGTGTASSYDQLARSISLLVERKIIDEQRPGGLLSGMA